MRLYDLGTIPWKQTQLIYHALAQCSEESIVICTPKQEYACVGFHQDISQELDIDFCEKNKIGVFRREIGGGTVFLDRNQLFYQIILDRNKAPLDQRVLFKKLLNPIIRTYKAMGIDAAYNPVSDLVVNGKKISGNGGGDIGNYKVMTGSILLDFDCETMCRVINLPSERFRGKVCDTMKENLTTVKKELGYIPQNREIISMMIANWEDMFGNLERGTLSVKTKEIMNALDTTFSSKEWLFKKGKQKSSRNVKIIEGINLIYDVYNGVKTCVETRNEVIHDIEVFEDVPEERISRLKKMLIGNKYDFDMISNSIDVVF
jgi:lipoate-protein ligase A